MELSKKELIEEINKLDETVKEIDKQLKEAGEGILTGSEELKEFQKLIWQDKLEYDFGERVAAFNENEARINRLDDKVKYFHNLKKVRNSPYFGMINFDGENIYIGISSIKKDFDFLVNDWRAPICSLFYDYGLGDVSYTSPAGIVNGVVSKKRQYKIENAKLVSVFDTNVNIDDEMLQDVLARTSSDKMKNIVNTIQVEQNQVIRDEKTNNIIVQGIAGSGKTSVALHRIAFLLYKLDYLTSGNVLIFSPNNVFTEYISDVLPDLGEDNTLQTTYHEFASSYTEEYSKVESYSHFVERYYKREKQNNELIKYKLSDNIIKSIEKFAKYFTKAAHFTDDLTYKKQVIKMSELNELLYVRYENKPLFERVDLIAEKINNKYFKGTAKDLISIKANLYKIANFKRDYKMIYRLFFETAIFKDSYKGIYHRGEHLRGMGEKTINYEDATIFIYLKCLLEGYPYQVSVKEVVIDEAQDYTYLQYKILKKIFKNAHFTILGDVNQTVNPFYKYDNLNILLNIFKENSKYIELNKTYRSSPEIIEYANGILGLNHISAIRKNVNLPVIKKPLSDIKHIGGSIKYLKDKYKSIAIITKSIEEAKILCASIKEKYSKVTIIDIETQSFNKQLVVSPAYGVKGLEFDSVIVINNFSNDPYLYYVAVTRAQHELIIYE